MKKNNSILIILSLVILILPHIVFAQMFPTIKLMLVTLGTYVNIIIRILFGLAIIYFFYGMGQFILHAGNEKIREEGKQKMIWGVIALFVMFSIFGIIQWIGVLFGIQAGGILELGQNGGSNATVTTSETFNGIYDPSTNSCKDFSGNTIPCP